MSIRVDVVARPEPIGRKGQLAQKMDIHYPGRRYPTEDVLFLDSEADGVALGTYAVDANDLVYPDAKRFGRMTVGTIRPKHLKRLKAAPAAAG